MDIARLDPMKTALNLLLTPPKIIPPLDPGFRPIAVGNRAYRAAVRASSRRIPLAIALERESGAISRFDTEILPPEGNFAADTICFVERLIKFLLWRYGGWRVVVGGPPLIGETIKDIYSESGARGFDSSFMGSVYQKPFRVDCVALDDVPAAREMPVALGGHLDGCRIGFDLGASDYKIAAVVDGRVVFTEEIPWDPKVQPDPDWHHEKITHGLKLAASKMPRVDAIGGSSAGILIRNQVMVASLFRAVPKDLFTQKVQPLFVRIQKEWGVPLEVVNDGDVTALAGGMSLGKRGVLGCAMGSSEAAGFLNAEGKVTGWLNELAFAPVDYNAQAAIEEWSGDRGVGALYFSQQAVAKLAPAADIDLPEAHQAEQLKFVQDLHRKDDPRAEKIFETIGVYLGYTIAYYAGMYGCSHLLILGRVTSGRGGDVILDKARGVLQAEFPEVIETVELHVPDEKMKRVGQAVAAASLPVI
jgi:predicted NBD/HSP70 family sugar kinase